MKFWIAQKYLKKNCYRVLIEYGILLSSWKVNGFLNSLWWDIYSTEIQKWFCLNDVSVCVEVMLIQLLTSWTLPTFMFCYLKITSLVKCKVFQWWRVLLRITEFLEFIHRLELWILENTTFRKLDLLPSSGEWGHAYSVGSLRKN
jgi:hypothetical protein